jgi:hypothetical protein
MHKPPAKGNFFTFAFKCIFIQGSQSHKGITYVEEGGYLTCGILWLHKNCHTSLDEYAYAFLWAFMMCCITEKIQRLIDILMTNLIKWKKTAKLQF